MMKSRNTILTSPTFMYTRGNNDWLVMKKDLGVPKVKKKIAEMG